MKAMGAMLILWGALCGYLQFRRQVKLPLQLGRALASDLTVLRCEICIHRRALPAILEQKLGSGLGAEYLWVPFSAMLSRSRNGIGMTVRECWECVVSDLPKPMATRLSPLGTLLGAGGDTLARAIDEVREELLNDLRSEEENQSVSLRLTGAMCICGASLLILILI